VGKSQARFTVLSNFMSICNWWW